MLFLSLPYAHIVASSVALTPGSVCVRWEQVWNEPNCGFYYQSHCCGAGCGNQSAYLELFVATRTAIKSVEPSLRVGGPATAQLGWLDNFFTEAVAARAPPDFLSSHLYPTDPVGPGASPLSHDRDGFATALSRARSLIAFTAAKLHLPPPPLLMTEINCGLGISCADAPYAASFVAYHAIKGAQATADAIPFQSYWTFRSRDGRPQTRTRHHAQYTTRRRGGVLCRC